PEEKRLRDLSLALAHAARHVEQQDHDRLHCRLLSLRALAIAQVIVRECRRFGARRALYAASLDRFLERAAPIEARARAAPVPALARPVVLFRLALLCLQIRQLHLVPEPVDDVVDAKLERVLDGAVFVAALAALLLAFLLRAADAIAGLGLPLPDALLLVRVAEPEAIVFEHPHRHAHRARASAQDIGPCDDLRQVLAHRFANLLVVPQPVARTSREEVVPAGFAGTDRPESA